MHLLAAIVDVWANAARAPTTPPSLHPLKQTLLLSTLLISGIQDSHGTESPPPAQSLEHTSFDLNILKIRGIDPQVAEYFRHTTRFTEGTRRVSLWVNGNQRGTLNARFDDGGHLCFNRTLLDQANLKVPEQSFLQDDCYDFIARFPQTEVLLRPNREEVSLVVSADSLRPHSETPGIYEQGGIGGLINYELLGMYSEFSGRGQRYYSANTELGLHAGGWVLRSRQIHTAQDKNRNFQMLYTYVQKSFIESKTLVQAGEININNSVFPGAAISGLQLLPEQALQNKNTPGATVEGIAQTQARVEIRQGGALIYSTLVPAGPFSLPNIQLLNSNTDLDVRVIEASGEHRSFSVPAASLSQFSYTAPGFSFAAGKVRAFNTREVASPIVITGTGGWLLSPSNNLSTGLMLGQNNYQAAAWTLDSRLTPDTSISLRNTLSKTGKEDSKGAQASLSASMRLTRTLNASASVTRRSSGYRDLLETTYADKHPNRHDASLDQYGLALGWSHPLLGSFSTGYATSNSANGYKTEHLNGSWNRAFPHFNLGANLEKTTSRSHNANNRWQGRNISSDSTAIYLNISIPFGNGRSARSYASKRNGNTQFGTNFSDSSRDLASYSLSAERNARDNRESFSGTLGMLPRYTSINLGYSQSANSRSNYNGQIRGGIALHKDGVTLSPYALTDTFAVVSIGDVSGVKLNTPSGSVWTDPWGRAVVAQLPPYQKSTVEIATKSLPRNFDIQNGHRSISPARGSVLALDFPVFKSRRLLLRALDENGNVLPKGSSVLNDKAQFVTAVIDDGKVFINNGHHEKPLTIRTTNGKHCALTFNLPPSPSLDVYIEKAEALCTYL